MNRSAISIIICSAVIIFAGCGTGPVPVRDEMSFTDGPRAVTSEQIFTEDGSKAALEDGLTLGEALQLAFTRSTGILSVAEEQKWAEGLIRQVSAGGYPSVTLNGVYARLSDTMKFEIPTLGTAEMGELNNTSISVSIMQPLYLGGKLGAGLRGAEAYRNSTREMFRGAQQDIAYGVYRMFYGVLLARENLKVAEESRTLALDHLDDIQKRREAGLAVELEVTQAEVRVSEAETGFVEAENNLEIAKNTLLTFLRLPADENAVIIGTLEAEKTEAYNKPELLLDKRPDVSRARENVAAQREALNAAYAQRRPNIFLGADYSYGKPGQFETENIWGDSWSVSLMISFPLYDGGAASAGIMKEQARLKQAEYAYEQARRDAELEYTTCVKNLAKTMEVLTAREQVVELAVKALAQVEVSFKQGLSRQMDILEGQVLLTKARLGYSAAVYDYMIAQVALRKSLGVMKGENKEER